MPGISKTPNLTYPMEAFPKPNLTTQTEGIEANINSKRRKPVLFVVTRKRNQTDGHAT
jgi:hypothetical protein